MHTFVVGLAGSEGVFMWVFVLPTSLMGKVSCLIRVDVTVVGKGALWWISVLIVSPVVMVFSVDTRTDDLTGSEGVRGRTPVLMLSLVVEIFWGGYPRW